MKELKVEVSQNSQITHENNFDLIRLIAALQVAIFHSGAHLNYTFPDVLDFLQFIPGVPIFFTVSGFLIGNSYYRKPVPRVYFINRALRIFPALWVCIAFTMLLLFMFGVLNKSSFADIEFWKWLICQVTIFQFYTPDLLRSWGVGTPNGSLWTIPVEVQFYIFLPIFINLLKRGGRVSILTLFGVLLIALISNYYYGGIDHTTLFAKLFHVSLLPFLMYFMFGFVSFLFWPTIKRFVVDKFLFWFFAYIFYIIVFYYLTGSYKLTYYPNGFGWISYLILAILTLSFAFSYRTSSKKILAGNDISYGVYIYHMVIINVILAANITHYSLLIALSSTIVLAFLSWKFVEKPFLKLKGRFIAA